MAPTRMDHKCEARQLTVGLMARCARWMRKLLQWAVHVPTLLYHWRLGWLLGHRFLMLTHRGRKTGAIHDTVLEVLHYDPVTHESIIFSGLGTRADWYRNIAARPALAIRTGRQWYRPMHRTLSPAEAKAFGARWQRAHPWEARLVAPIVTRLSAGASAAPATFGLPPDAVFVAFRPRTTVEASPVETDVTPPTAGRRSV